MTVICLFLYVNKYGNTNLKDVEEPEGFRLNFSKAVQPMLRHVVASSYFPE